MELKVLSDEGKQYSYEPPLILAVEDNEDNLLIINYVVESLNCRFVGEANGGNTLLLAKEYQPDLILLDIMLPQVNGVDIFHSLKQDTATRAIPVIAVTALARIEDKQRILEAGFDNYISKPYMLEEIEDMIRHYLPTKLNIA